MISRLAYEDNPVETFEKERDQNDTSLVFVKVIEPQPVHDGKKTEVRQRMLMGIARRVSTTKAQTVPVDIIHLCLVKYPCVITGHSLGGAVSTLIGLDVLLSLSAFRWESCETRVPKTGGDQAVDQATEQKTFRLSVITFGAPLVTCQKLAMKASKEVFHNILISGDPIMVLLNMLPELLQNPNNEYKFKVINLLQEVLKAAVIVHTPLAVVLKTEIDKFRELIKRAKTVSGANRILEPFGIYYLYNKMGCVLEIAKSQSSFLSFFNYLGKPATFFERLDTDLLECHSIQSYVDIFTKSAALRQQFNQQPFAPDSNNIQHIQQLLDQLIYPSSDNIVANSSFIETNETERSSYLQADIEFPFPVPERLFAVVYAQTKGDHKKLDDAVKVEYRRRINIDNLIARTSVIVLIPANNLSWIQQSGQLVLVTLFGDIVTVDVVMHYIGFIGTLKETTSHLLMNILLRVILINQSDISMAYKNAIQAASDNNPIQALMTMPNDGNTKEIQDLFDKLLAVARLDLLQNVFGDVVEHVRSEMGFSPRSVSDDAIRDMPQTFLTTPSLETSPPRTLSSLEASPLRIVKSIESTYVASIVKTTLSLVTAFSLVKHRREVVVDVTLLNHKFPEWSLQHLMHHFYSRCKRPSQARLMPLQARHRRRSRPASTSKKF
ncbi:hypothetical protein BC936DRAFT_138137 [Jimgerdemannia flammicorona]|uniref:Fungal lipase-type domain-containing protein n=1 Tax=Jimgerdemannia flammicorona TaxID=994334 RepID=A0A433CW30_9FUNG|nr:hypothetical protein BC936DRAFT_138137 [Jimgerdemannia flammicorona]